MRALGMARWLVLVGFVVFAALPASAAEVQRVQANGFEAWLVEDHSNPMISVRFAFRGGAVTDPEGLPGRSRMAMALLDEGAGDLDAKAFQERAEELAVKLSFDASLDMVTGRLTTLTKNSAAAFDLLGLALTAPRFDDDAVLRIREQMLAALRQQSEEPSALASKKWMAEAFPDHPYGRPVWGTPASIEALTADDLRAFVGERLTRDGLIIGVVGDVTPETLAPLLDRAFGGLPERGAPVAVADVEPNAADRVTVVAKPVPQSVIVFGHGGLDRTDEDYYAATVLNRIFGAGSFTSRLYREVREERGLTYSVGTRLMPLLQTALLRGFAATSNERVGETIDVLRAEWARMAETGATPEEVADAKTFLIGSFPLRFTSSGRIADMLVGMQLYDLGIDYLDRRNALIEAVTIDDVNRVARALLKPESLAVVVAGEPEGIEPTN